MIEVHWRAEDGILFLEACHSTEAPQDDYVTVAKEQVIMHKYLWLRRNGTFKLESPPNTGYEGIDEFCAAFATEVLIDYEP